MSVELLINIVVICLLVPTIVFAIILNKRLEELQGSIGTYRLKEEINGRLNRILAPVKVNDVLFKEILIQ